MTERIKILDYENQFPYERLGHADIKTTMNTYGHALKQADEIASQKLDDALFKDSKTQ